MSAPDDKRLTPFQAFALALVVGGLVWAGLVVLVIQLFA